jgi:DNA invertase Pin-like site-specific DNA recombinase
MSINAVIYARYSSDNQREESIEGQLRECKAYADYNVPIIRYRYFGIYIQGEE